MSLHFVFKGEIRDAHISADGRRLSSALCGHGVDHIALDLCTIAELVEHGCDLNDYLLPASYDRGIRVRTTDELLVDYRIGGAL